MLVTNLGSYRIKGIYLVKHILILQIRVQTKKQGTRISTDEMDVHGLDFFFNVFEHKRQSNPFLSAMSVQIRVPVFYLYFFYRIWL